MSSAIALPSGLPAEQNFTDFLDDGKLHSHPCSQCRASLRGVGAFGHAAVGGAVLLQRLALRQCHAQRAIPAETSGRGQNKVAHAGEAGEGERAGAQGHAEPGDLGESAGDQRRPGIMPQPEPLENAGRDGDDVFERAGQLDADDVVMRIDPEPRGGEDALRIARGRFVPRRGHHQGRLALTHLSGKAGPGQGRKASARAGTPGTPPTSGPGCRSRCLWWHSPPGCLPGPRH